MQMVVNELSAKFPSSSAADARDVMESFVNTYFRVKEIIHNDMILVDRDYESFLLAPGYRIEQWRNDRTVDMEIKRRFRSMLNRSGAYNSEEFRREHEEMLCAEFQLEESPLEDKVSIGCQLAYVLDGVAVSFLTDDYWKQPAIKGIYRSLQDTGEIEEEEAEIPNVSCKENIEQFSSNHQKQTDKQNRNQFKSGVDILEHRKELFPNLLFCGSALKQLQHDIGKTEISQVYKKLMELQRAAEKLDGAFNAKVLNHATPESVETLKRFEEEHTFILPDGSSQLFSWHIRFTGSYAGRIFFEPVAGERHIYIGHVGKKLPTVEDH